MCSAMAVTELTPLVGRCTNSKCGCTLKLTKCGKNMVAKLIVEGKEGKRYVVTAFNPDD